MLKRDILSLTVWQHAETSDAKSRLRRIIKRESQATVSGK